MTEPLHAFDFLESSTDKVGSLPGHLVLVGDDRFLKRLSLAKLRRDLTSDDAPPTEYDGERAEWRDVMDELSTVSLFGDGPRVVVLTSADEFVSRHRGQLEQLVGTPVAAGRLVLDLKTLASNTRLYKSAIEHGTIIECRAPQTKRGKNLQVDEGRFHKWIRKWGETTHGLVLGRGAEVELVALAGMELGRIDQELAKLALFSDRGEEVTVSLVQQVVGGWRTTTTWDLLDAALEGRAADALQQLERLLQAGEVPQMILGAILWSLRRFADAAQHILEAESLGRKVNIPGALELAGFKNWPVGALGKAEKQLRQIGRHRAATMYRQLMDLDLAMKGSHSSPDRSRWALEQFLLSLYATKT